MARQSLKSRRSNARPDIEEFLRKYNVDFELRPGVPVSLFDAEKSLRNQARLGAPLDEDTVARYVEALYAGDIFPPLLAEEQSDGTLLVLDGNHRLRAHAIAGINPDVYVCSAPGPTLVLITYLANVKHGLPASAEDRLHHAMFLIDGGVSQADAASQLQVPLKELKRAVSQTLAARRADDCDIARTDWERLGVSIRNRLAGIHTDEGFRAAVALAGEAGLSSAETDALVAHMNETRSGRRQGEIVAAERLAMRERIVEMKTSGNPNTKGKRVVTPRSRLLSAVGIVNALPPLATYEAEPIPQAMADEVAERLDGAIDRLTAIRKLIG